MDASTVFIANPDVADSTGMTPLYAAVDMNTLAFMHGRPTSRPSGLLDSVDMVKALPCPTYDPVSKTWKFPDGVPAWAMSCCEELAHVLGEQWYSINSNIGRFNDAHNAGIKSQNDVRKDLGQGSSAKLQNLDRKNEFHDERVRTEYSSSNESHTQYMQDDKGSLKVTYK